MKSNIGHTGAAAGVAGLIKTALMLRHRELVPTLHFRRPNPELELDSSPFRIAAAHEPLPADGPLIAGLSSFGMGGTNAHAILESPPEPRRAAPRTAGRGCSACPRPPPTALDRLRTELADRLDDRVRSGPARLDDVAWTLATGRRRFPHRLAVVADRPRGRRRRAARRAARAPGRGGAAGRVPVPGPGRAARGVRRRGAPAPARVPGRRSTSWPAGRASASASTWRRCCALDADPAWVRDTVHQQLGLFASATRSPAQLQDLGVEPAGMLGHSVGEYVAATVAGLWGPPTRSR